MYYDCYAPQYNKLYSFVLHKLLIDTGWKNWCKNVKHLTPATLILIFDVVDRFSRIESEF